MPEFHCSKFSISLYCYLSSVFPISQFILLVLFLPRYLEIWHKILVNLSEELYNVAAWQRIICLFGLRPDFYWMSHWGLNTNDFLDRFSLKSVCKVHEWQIVRNNISVFNFIITTCVFQAFFRLISSGRCTSSNACMELLKTVTFIIMKTK